jgi:uncharacterized membrane protein YphA (DoxX/SURF4 family)
MTKTVSELWRSVAHDQRRSVDLVRIATAVVLLSHPAHALIHPDDVHGLASDLDGHGVPLALGLAWAAVLIQLLCSLALLVPRFAVPAALGSVLVLAGGAAVVCAPGWYAVGERSVEGRPGIELNVLLVSCLGAVAWTYWPRRGGADVPVSAKGGLEIIRVASALALLTHGWGAFVQWDFEGMRGWGESMSRHGWPYGVGLVWSIKGTELVCSILRLARRLVVPACFGHLSYLVPALWIEHHTRWFVVSPNGRGMQNGIEFSLMLIVCSVACILAYWPQPARAVEATTSGPERKYATTA